MGKDVFISYASGDQAAAERICGMLEARGLDCWIAPRDIAPGGVYSESILDGIDTVFGMILILSENANASTHVRNEIERAVSKGKAIIPVRIEDVKPSKALELFVMSSHWVEAWQADVEARIDHLAAAMLSFRGKRNTSSAAPIPAARPAAAPIASGPSPQEAMFRSLAEGAWADGVLSDSERHFLAAKAKELGLDMQRAKEILFGCKPANATWENKSATAAPRAAAPVATAAPATAADSAAVSAQLAQLQLEAQKALLSLTNSLNKKKQQGPNSGSIIAGLIVVLVGSGIVYGGVYLGMTYPPWGWAIGGIIILYGLKLAIGSLPYLFAIQSAENCPKCGTSGAVVNRQLEVTCKKCGKFT